MNKGMEILIARMKSNPEEFKPNGYQVGGHSKWEDILYRWADCLDEDDLTAFKKELRLVRQELFTREVMKHLLRADERLAEENLPETMTFTSNGRLSFSAQPSNWDTTNHASLTVGKEMLDEDTVRIIREMVKENSKKEQP